MRTTVLPKPPARLGRRAYYTHGELAFRPIEHIIEELSCRELGLALGSPGTCCHGVGHAVKMGRRELRPTDVDRIRAYLRGEA